MATEAFFYIESTFAVLTPLFLFAYPELGRLAVWSKHTPKVFMAAVGLGLFCPVGLLIDSVEGQSFILVAWAPLFQLSWYWVALRVFVRLRHDFPKDVFLDFTAGRGWDRLFGIVYVVPGLAIPVLTCLPRQKV